MLERVMHNRFFRGTALFVRRYFDHRVARDSAALTYYLLFAMFPLLIFLSNLVGFFAVDIEGFLRQLGTIIPAEVLDLLIQYLRYVSRVSSRTLMTFSLIFSIWFPMRAANALLLSVRKAYGMGRPTLFLRHQAKVFLYTICLILTILLSLVLVTVGRSVLNLCGSYADTLAKVAALCRNDAMRAAVAELEALAVPLEKAGGVIRLDMTLAGEMEYYNGLVFQGYLKALPRPLLKGGRYDLLMQKFTPGAGAIGFAVYLDELDRLSAPLPPVQKNSTDRVMLNVALPKGRLGDKVYHLLAGIGYGCPEDYNATRKLVVENPEAGIRYFLVKPSDVAIYVEHGAADVGIVGKDILTEASADVYELLDTGLGKCRMCVAAPADYKDDPSRPVRVATKFVNIAKSYYASMGRDIDIIKLNGSIELAPILGLSDVIVDIVETGTTLRENGLKVVTEFMPISARFIANKASYQFKHAEMDTMLEKLRAELQNKEEAK